MEQIMFDRVMRMVDSEAAVYLYTLVRGSTQTRDTILPPDSTLYFLPPKLHQYLHSYPYAVNSIINRVSLR